MSGKRHFPYYSAVPEIELKRPALAGAAPGRERAEPRVFQEGPGFRRCPRGGVQLRTAHVVRRMRVYCVKSLQALVLPWSKVCSSALQVLPALGLPLAPH